MKKHDTGNYTCSPSNSPSATVTLNVINGKSIFYYSQIFPTWLDSQKKQRIFTLCFEKKTILKEKQSKSILAANVLEFLF